MIYAMSDIHGCLDALEKKMAQVELLGENRLILLGDYIDYGPQSGQVLQYVFDLQKEYGSDKVIVLKGNHEAMFLEWLDEYRNPDPGELERELAFNEWLRTDGEHHFNVVRTLVSEEQMAFFEKTAHTSGFDTLNRTMAGMIMSNHGEVIRWLKRLPSYYEADNAIYVHAGVDEEAGEEWKWGSGDEILLWKFPKELSHFYKTVVAGHIGTGERQLANDRHFHNVFFDGDCHYFIDGGVYKHGKLNLLAYDESDEKYYSINDAGAKTEVTKTIRRSF